MGGVSSSTGATSNIPPASAGGDRNQAAATTSATAPQPARGANSFTMGEARRRIQRNGFTNVTGLKKDDGGVWRGKASKGGTSADIWLDYKGNVGQMADASSSMGSMPGATMSTPGTTTPGTTMGGTTMSRTPTPGTNPAGSSATAR